MSNKPTDVSIQSIKQYHLPVEMRMPLKFGSESIDSVTCLRVAVTVCDQDGNEATGWGETPLSVTWAWPSASMTYADRFDRMIAFSRLLADAWKEQTGSGHPIEIGHHFIEEVMPAMIREFNATKSVPDQEDLPLLAALIATSAFDIAVHDAYGNLHGVDIYDTYNAKYMSKDLDALIEADEDCQDSFVGKYPEDYLVFPESTTLPVWHLVGGLDPIEKSDCSGNEPTDGYPVTLREWILQDGLKCLKIKLRGNDSAWDYDRIVRVGEMSLELGVEYLSTDFNCTVDDPEYVNEILDRLLQEHPKINDLILYVEQPFPHDLEANQIDVSSVSARQPLFLDESAHDWRFVRLGRKLGWTGVALKTCKTQTGALLSLCWAKAHGMPLMVQDLTNPMLAQVPHVRLAAHAGTIRGVECNGMQFYPEASLPEQKIHPGIYQRRNGILDLASLSGPGFGYRVDEIDREISIEG